MRRQILTLMRACSPVVKLLLVSAPLIIVQIAGALPIPFAGTGVFNGGGLSVQVTGAAAPSGPCINFYNGATPDACPPSGTSTFLLNAPADAIFGTVGTTTGTTHDFVLANQTGSSPPSAPYTAGVAFITLNGFTFDINNIVVPNPLACPPPFAPGVCSTGDFVLTQSDLNTTGAACPGGTGTCGHVSVQFSANGIGYSGASATGFTNYTFTWTSQFDNETISDLLSKANGTAAGITNSASFSAAPLPTSPVPEPGEFALVGGGLLIVGMLSRSRKLARRS